MWILGFIMNLLAFIFSIGIIIFIHELGHFIFAKRAGILCHEFALGMGPVLYKKKVGETTYALRAIPIGGFVSMAGEDINNALIKIGDTIGLSFEGSKVTKIDLRKTIDSDVKGTVASFDLYGANGSNLYITLIGSQGQEESFEVKRDAFYQFGYDKEVQIAPHERSFESKTLLQRFLAIVAGPTMNFVLAVLLFFVVSLFIGKPILSQSIIGAVTDNYPAQGVLLPGDEIVSINGLSITDWSDISQALRLENYERVIDVEISRNGEILTVQIAPRVFVNSVGIGSGSIDYDNNFGVYLGVTYGKASNAGLAVGDVVTDLKVGDGEFIPVRSWRDLLTIMNGVDIEHVTFRYQRNDEVKEAIVETFGNAVLINQNVDKIELRLGINPQSETSILWSVGYGFNQTKNTVIQIGNTLNLVFGGSEQVGVSDLAGPLGIFSLVSSSLAGGILSLISFTAFLSVNIGMLNILPIPALDGGRLVFLGYEAIFRKPVNKKVENIIHTAMFFALMALFVYVTFNDILRLW